jgi:hypothetical protein
MLLPTRIKAINHCPVDGCAALIPLPSDDLIRWTQTDANGTVHMLELPQSLARKHPHTVASGATLAGGGQFPMIGGSCTSELDIERLSNLGSI